MERFFSIMAFAGVLVIFSSSFLGAALDDELVFHLPFDEGAGKVAKDNSKNGHDAQLIANNKWVDGKIGKGIEITAEGQDCVQIDAVDTLKIEGEISILAWINSAGWAGSGDQWLDKNNHNGGEHTSYGMGVFGDGATVQLLLGGGNSRPTLSVPNTLEIKQWQHVAGTYDGSDMKIFINGELAGEQAQKFDFQGTNDQPVRIGCSKDRPQYTFNGAIDEVAVFRRALSLDEIKQIMNGDLLAVSPKDKLATVWGTLKSRQ